MSHPSYILAKYVPELMRNEPRNFGVVVWTPWGVWARFLGEEKGILDGRRIPNWIQSKESYREWVGSWRSALIRGKARSKDRTVVEAQDPRFLQALSSVSHGNYILADGGAVLDEVTKEDVPAMLNFLFETLVLEGSDKEAARAALDIERACNKIISHTRAYRNPNFHRDKSVFCRIAPDVVDEINFDYYVGNGTPERVYQRIPLGNRFETTLHSSAWQFEKVIQNNIISRENSAALVFPTPEQRETSQYQRAVSVLQTQTRVIDLSIASAEFERELDSLFGLT